MDYKTLLVKCLFNATADEWSLMSMKLPPDFESLPTTPLTFPCSICGNMHTVFIDPKDKSEAIYKVVTVTDAPEDAVPDEPVLHKAANAATGGQKAERDLSLYATCPSTGESVKIGLTLPSTEGMTTYTFQCSLCGQDHTITGKDAFHLPGPNN